MRCKTWLLVPDRTALKQTREVLPDGLVDVAVNLSRSSEIFGQVVEMRLRKINQTLKIPRAKMELAGTLAIQAIMCHI